MAEEENASNEANYSYTSVSDFFETVPPGEIVLLENAVTTGSHANRLAVPELQMYCGEVACNGLRFFRCTATSDNFPYLAGSQEHNCFLYFRCSNCRRTLKTFSISLYWNRGNFVRAYKYGELPHFGPPVPARLITLIGGDRELFLKGRRCENQGLGIAAFVYYRRVVEAQRKRIISEIRRVAVKVGAPQNSLDLLDKAANETQFSKALSIAKDAMPESLKIGAHNPLAILHDALSEGLHEQTDDECLQIASSIRVVLADLSERLGQALKDEAQLQNAISALLNRQKPKSSRTN